MTINITVLLESKEEFTEKLKELFEGLVAKSRGEAGCLQYDIHQNIENPQVFILHEVWENKTIFDLHNSQQYVKDFFAATPNILKAEPKIYFTTKLA